MAFVPEGQAGSSQARSAWSHEENSSNKRQPEENCPFRTERIKRATRGGAVNLAVTIRDPRPGSVASFALIFLIYGFDNMALIY